MDEGRFVTVCPIPDAGQSRVSMSPMYFTHPGQLSHFTTQNFAPPVILPPSNVIINSRAITHNQPPDGPLLYHHPFSQQPQCATIILPEVLHNLVAQPSPPDMSSYINLPQFQLLPSTSLLISNPLKAEPVPRLQSFATSSAVSQSHRNQQRLFNDNTSSSKFTEPLKLRQFQNVRLDDLVGSFVQVSKDQLGSRFIQQKIENTENDNDDVEMLMKEILPSAVQLSVDVFGNYVIQKILDFGSSGHKNELKKLITDNVRQLALHTYGCRVVQKALEVIEAEDKRLIMEQLDDCIIECCKDQSGNHVVQKAVELLSPDDVDFILKHFKGKVVSMSCHLYGCRVIQRCLEYVPADQCKFITDEILDSLRELMCDQYGNYVVQYMVEKGSSEEKDRIISCIKGEMALLSQHKYASNVVEKCITHSSANQLSSFFEEICSTGDIPNDESVESKLSSLEALADSLSPCANSNGSQAQKSTLYNMLKDQFGNYVIQKMLDVADEHQGKMLVSRIKPHLASLKSFAYGKYILAKLERCKSKGDEVD